MTATSATKSFPTSRGGTRARAQIIAVGGGKGGIGKSFISSSLAIFLGHLGRKTVIVDLDIGAANLHTALGAAGANPGINEYLMNPALNLLDVVQPTHFPNLSLISGASEFNDSADLSEANRSRIMSSLYSLNADFVVLDLSAGSHSNTLDFFLTANHKITVFTPEPSSIENAYRFLKAAFYRRLKRYESQLGLEAVLHELMSHRTKNAIRSPADLIRMVGRRDPSAGKELLQLLAQLNFEIVLNQVRSIKDAELGPSIQNVCSKYFGTPFSYLGHIEHDNAVWQALRNRKHLISEYPHSKTYAQLLAIARRLVSSVEINAMVS